MPRLINAAGLEIVKSSEGLRLQAYQDTGGVWTIGRGHTPAVRGQQITLIQADQLLAADIAWAEDAVGGATIDVPTTDNQFSAMVSETFNIGAGAFRSSTFLRCHRDKDYAGCAEAMQWFNKDNGRVLEALVGRRKREAALYLAVGPTNLPPAVPVGPDMKAEVMQLQTMLQGLGVYSGAIDGDPGPLTVAALRVWRASA